MILEKIGHAIRTRSAFQYRSHSKDPNVAAPIVDTHGEVEIGPDGRVVSVIGVCHDVTRQVMAEAERENAQRAYRTIAEEASDIIFLHEDGEIVFASGALARILGRTRRNSRTDAISISSIPTISRRRARCAAGRRKAKPARDLSQPPCRRALCLDRNAHARHL